MGIPEWIMIIWLIFQFGGKCYRLPQMGRIKRWSGAEIVGAGVGTCIWLFSMIGLMFWGGFFA